MRFKRTSQARDGNRHPAARGTASPPVTGGESDGSYSYTVSSVCATENGHYDITGQVTSAGGNRYQGTVISGNESGRVLIFNRGNHLSVSVTSPRGSARLTLHDVSSRRPASAKDAAWGVASP